jgi:hypothetical protein
MGLEAQSPASRHRACSHARQERCQGKRGSEARGGVQPLARHVYNSAM